jgi:hypothetical protein
VLLRIQRWYAYAVFALRDLIRVISFDPLHEWKTRVTLTMAQVLFALAAFWTTTTIMGHRPAIGRAALLFVFSILYLILYLVNGYLERRLLPRFGNDFLRLGRTGTLTAKICVLLFVALAVVAAAAAATADRRLLHLQ